MILALLVMPLVGHSADNQSSYEIDANRVILTHQESSRTDVVVVTEAGDLTVNGHWITIDQGDRKLLRQAFVEFVKLDDMKQEFTADITLIVAETAAEDTSATSEEIKAELAIAIHSIEGKGGKIEKQAAKVTKLGGKIRDQIPALAHFNWSLDN